MCALETGMDSSLAVAGIVRMFELTRVAERDEGFGEGVNPGIADALNEEQRHRYLRGWTTSGLINSIETTKGYAESAKTTMSVGLAQVYSSRAWKLGLIFPSVSCA